MASIQTYLDAFDRDGYVIVPDVSDPWGAVSAIREMESLYHRIRFGEYMLNLEKGRIYPPEELAYGFQFP